MNKLMLYYHIPFCLSKCAYCAFYSKPCIDSTTKAAYKQALIRQTESFNYKGEELVSVYFGGGTPTVMGCDALCEVLDTVKRVFTVDGTVEITVEANPKTVSYEELCKLRQAGFNRLSLGAQSFNDKTLALLGRAHSSEDFVHCFEDARRAGFDNISADLIFALPDESTEDFLYSLNRLISLSPEHISVYSLSIEEGTRLYTEQKKYRFPTEDEEEKQYFTLCDTLTKSGYVHYEISNFAKKGYEARHNSGYWKRIPYFGFGAAAHSFYGGERFSAVEDIDSYINKPRFIDVEKIGAEAAEEERILLGLRLAEGIEYDTEKIPKYLFTEGYIKKSGQRIALTEKGFRVSNRIISLLI